MADMHSAVEPILLRAGEMMLEFQHPKVFDKGRHADFVTEADIAVQNFLMEELAKAFPEASFFAEEKKDNVLGEGFTFIIDPIDGTTNYFRRRRCSSISIGAVEGKQPVYGAIYDPYRGEVYHAEKGKGAWCAGERLHVSEAPLDHAIIGMGTSPYYEELFELTGKTLSALLPRTADVRRTGSACIELCDVAAGRSDAHFEWKLQPWDYCAGTLIVREAGGECGSILGGDVTYDRPCPHLAASRAIFEDVQKLLQDVYYGRTV